MNSMLLPVEIIMYDTLPATMHDRKMEWAERNIRIQFLYIHYETQYLLKPKDKLNQYPSHQWIVNNCPVPNDCSILLWSQTAYIAKFRHLWTHWNNYSYSQSYPSILPVPLWKYDERWSLIVAPGLGYYKCKDIKASSH